MEGAYRRLLAMNRLKSGASTPAGVGSGTKAGAAITYIASTTAGAATTGAAVTTTGIDTTGANFLIIAVGTYNYGAAVSDTQGGNNNAWTALTMYGSDNANPGNVKLYYSVPTYTGADHTFTVAAGSDSYTSIAVMAFSGVGAIQALTDKGAATFTPGSVTPTAAGYLVVTAAESSELAGSAASLTGSFSSPITQFANSGVDLAMAYKIVTDTNAVNPTWSMTGVTTHKVSAIVVFSAS